MCVDFEAAERLSAKQSEACFATLGSVEQAAVGVGLDAKGEDEVADGDTVGSVFGD